MVYILNKDGNPLMPTERHGKVRHLLKNKQAKIVKKCPFTIQLTYHSNNYLQPVILGVDAGSKTIGLSATTKEIELYAAEITLRNDIVDLLSTRREYRTTRRNRKTRYRKARFLNRTSSKKEGWLAPSIRQKIETHHNAIDQVIKILPISDIIVETASFDIQKIKNPEISGTDYQMGEQLGFWNVREYVLCRDGHQCQCCKGKSKPGDIEEIKKLRKILNVHHIESRKIGGNAPNNLITLCEYCHKEYHAGRLELKGVNRGMRFKDAAFMGIMRWAFYNELKNRYPNKVHMTYGYITKHTRITNELPKTHYIDARCITGNPTAKPLDTYYDMTKLRRHSRSLFQATIKKGGMRISQKPVYISFGFKANDIVKYYGQEYSICSRGSKGALMLRTKNHNVLRKADNPCDKYGNPIPASPNYKKVKYIRSSNGFRTICQFQNVA